MFEILSNYCLGIYVNEFDNMEKADVNFFKTNCNDGGMVKSVRKLFGAVKSYMMMG